VVEARTRTILFRAVRELLINVAKHAGVHRAMVRISESENHVTIVVEDNGAGFDPRVLRSSSMTRGFGLFSIRERLDYLGGKLEIQSRRGKKTTVTITMPLAWEDKRRGGG
jgi:signal transduction histidine kinase